MEEKGKECGLEFDTLEGIIIDMSDWKVPD